ncbi:MAG: V-type ATP synthase subunit F [Clostridiales bacterium GWF2_36_10]|nr:MAG: V-type ATP synthase subunit F [Clostridiales bacterium GWF2_36_10]HAN21994.1 V-type ATP synthase subunit F [Clostridiales bacterium]
MYKIAVLGERDSIYGYAALGLNIFPVNNVEEAVKTLKYLANGQFAVVYITESYHAKLESEIENYRESCIPAIIPIPGVSGNTGMGMLNVKRSVERAVGSDIIFNDK